MEQIGRNAVDEDSGYLNRHRYVLHDRDTKRCAAFRKILETGGVKCLRLPRRSPNLNAFAERWVRSVKEECLSKLILFGEGALRRGLTEYLAHYHGERNHQGKENLLLFPLKNERQGRNGSQVQMQATSWRVTELLFACRMNIFTKRVPCRQRVPGELQNRPKRDMLSDVKWKPNETS